MNDNDDGHEKEQRKRLEKERLTDDEVDLLYDIIEITAKILEENNIKYSISGGTYTGSNKKWRINSS